MELDTDRMEIRLPEPKLTRLRALLREWEGKRAGELLSLIGYLHHASKAMRQGRTFAH